MSQNIYECMFIFDSNRYAKDPGAVSSRVNETITGLDGDVRVSRLWNEQKLAFPIKGHRKGSYWLTYFRIESSKLVELNRAFQLNDDILRHLVLKIDPRLEESLVAHAQGKKLASESEPEVKAAADDSGDDTEDVNDKAREDKVVAGVGADV